MKAFVLIATAIGIILLAAAGVTFLSNLYFVDHAELAKGTVTNISTSIDPDDESTSYCPVVEFTTKAGQVVSYDSNVCSSPAAYAVGDKVDVYYDPQNPQNARLNTFWSQNLSSLSLFCLGLPFLLIGLFLGLAVRKSVFTKADAHADASDG